MKLSLKNLLKMIDSGPEFEARKKMMQQAAANSIAKRERQAISIKIPKNEISTFKQKAEQEWLKYQTKLNQLIYMYNRGQLTSNS
jgi:predicted DNA binding CopG/RHH family protein